MTARIEVTFENPPIPVRCCDYRAYLADSDPECRIEGWGATAAAAEADLLDKLQDECGCWWNGRGFNDPSGHWVREPGCTEAHDA